MRILYLDCFSGLSGDMTMGALLDLGVRLTDIEKHLGVLGVDGFTLRSWKARDGAMAGTRFVVELEGQGDPRDGGGAGEGVQRQDPGERSSASSDARLYAGGTGAGDGTRRDPAGNPAPAPQAGHSPHPHRHDHLESKGGHRSHRNIVHLLESSDLPAPIKRTSLKIFQKLAEAEGRVHGIPEAQVTFHEVGAVDSIVDIVGVAVALYLLGIDEIHSSPLPLGHGRVECQHGTLPLPAPATLEMLKGVPVHGTTLPFEMVTPTGAAIVSALATRFGQLPSMIPERIGYGLGRREGGTTPNLLRAVLGTAATGAVPGLSHEPVAVLEADIDDMNPQFYDPLTRRLLDLGALDVTLTPLIMKKGRPGVLVRVVCPVDLRPRFTGILLSETTTLGVRHHTMERACVARRLQAVDTRFGTIRVKLGLDGRRITNVMPEFEDCLEAARTHDVPLKRVHQEATRQALDRWGDRYPEETSLEK